MTQPARTPIRRTQIGRWPENRSGAACGTQGDGRKTLVLTVVFLSWCAAASAQEVLVQVERFVALSQAYHELFTAGRFDEAEEKGKEALAIATGAELEHEVQEVVVELAELYRSQRRYGEAEALLGHWLGIFQGEFGPDALETVGLTTELAVLGYLREDLAQAEEYYLQALSICKREPAHHVPPSVGVQARFLQVMRRHWGLDAPGRPGRQQDLEMVRGLLNWQLETTSKLFPPDHEAVVFLRKQLDAAGDVRTHAPSH